MIIIYFIELFLVCVTAWFFIDVLYPVLFDKPVCGIIKSVFRKKATPEKPSGKNVRSNA